MSSCPPGDIRITPIHNGFMVGRVLPRTGQVMKVQYIATVNHHPAAVELARQLAALGQGARVFICKTDDHCEEVT